jgi:hypothetical protein
MQEPGVSTVATTSEFNSILFKSRCSVTTIRPHRRLVRKLCNQAKITAHGLDLVAQGREQQVTALFQS